MNVDLKYSSSSADDDSIHDKYLSHGHVETPHGSLFMLCTGLGGPHGGIIASSITFEIVRRIITTIPGRTPDKLLHSALIEANRTLYERASRNPYMLSLGTAFAALLVNPLDMRNGFICHVGCSRIYQIREDCITRLTMDHSGVNKMIERGVLDREDAWRNSPHSVVTRSIGISEDLEPEISRIFIQEGDRYIICTTGISDHINDIELLRLFQHNTQKYADSILDRARKRGSRSNTVVQIIDISEVPDRSEDKNLYCMPAAGQ